MVVTLRLDKVFALTNNKTELLQKTGKNIKAQFKNKNMNAKKVCFLKIKQMKLIMNKFYPMT